MPYYTKDAFEDFKKGMKPAIRQKYEEGKGSELKETDFPPKMASVSSSSRFCYLALSDMAEQWDITFEYGCRIDGIKGGTPPQLDAFLAAKNTFVEVKCHEIFDSKKASMAGQYKALLYGKNNDFGFPADETKVSGEIEVPFEIIGLKTKESCFDLKQFLCHLLGVRDEMKRKALDQATLGYLYFRPVTADPQEKAELDEIFNALASEVETVFENQYIKNFCSKNNIDLKAYIQYDNTMDSVIKANMIRIF